MPICLLLSAVLSSCEHPCSMEENRADSAGETRMSRVQILFRLAEALTKVPETTANTLVRDGFQVSATTGNPGNEKEAWTNASFSRNGEVFSGDKWWSPADSSYHFYASNADLAFDASGALVYASTEEDVVCAHIPIPSFRQPNELAFQHIFARLDKVDIQGPERYTTTVLSVSITPYISGTYNLRTHEWSDLQPGEPVLLGADNDLWCVPGYYSLTVQYTLTLGDYTQTFTKDRLIVLPAGKTSNLLGKLPTGQAQEMEYTLEVADWTDHVIDLGLYGH